MKAILLRLLTRMDEIGEDHAELGDTDVREQMHQAVHDGFLQPVNGYVLPDAFGMFSAKGNQAIRKGLASFLPAANAWAAENGVTKFHDRLAAFQDEDVQTETQSGFDDFFGWADPDSYDATGERKR